METNQLSEADEKAIVGFVAFMRTKLAANAHKTHWLHSTQEYLLERLREEVKELEEACHYKPTSCACREAFCPHIEYPADPNDIVEECADVANFAMMIAHHASKSPLFISEKKWGNH